MIISVFFLIKINEFNNFILIVGVAEWCWFHFRGRHMGVSLDIENYCTLRLFFDPFNFGWSQPTKLTGSRYPVAFPDIITRQIDMLPA